MTLPEGLKPPVSAVAPFTGDKGGRPPPEAVGLLLAAAAAAMPASRDAVVGLGQRHT